MSLVAASSSCFSVTAERIQHCFNKTNSPSLQNMVSNLSETSSACRSRIVTINDSNNLKIDSEQIEASSHHCSRALLSEELHQITQQQSGEDLASFLDKSIMGDSDNCNELKKNPTTIIDEHVLPSSLSSDNSLLSLSNKSHGFASQSRDLLEVPVNAILTSEDLVQSDNYTKFSNTTVERVHSVANTETSQDVCLTQDDESLSPQMLTRQIASSSSVSLCQAKEHNNNISCVQDKGNKRSIEQKIEPSSVDFSPQDNIDEDYIENKTKQNILMSVEKCATTEDATSAVDQDNLNCLTYWNEENKSNKVLHLTSSLLLHQPPPHFTVSKQQILSDFRGKRLYLFLDYDGTLTPIVNNPWEASLSPLMRQLLYDLASDSKNMVTVGIVTGRALTSVKNFVQIIASEHLNFIYAASHGFHIEAAGKMLHHRVGSRYIPILNEAAAEVQKASRHISGVTLEDNEFAVSVHYRNAPEGSEEIVEKIISDILKRFPELKMTRGKKVFELRINVVWDKGRAVFWLLNAMRVDPFQNETRVIYIGDDLTDEDAFRAVRQLKNSLTVLVSEIPASRPTAATCFVKDPSEVAKILQLLLGLARETEDKVV